MRLPCSLLYFRMTSTGLSCIICAQPLLRFLFNPNGDYILNCSSATCTYGILHASVHKAETTAEQLQPIIANPECNIDMPDFAAMLDDDLYAKRELQNDEENLEEDLQAHFSLAAKEDRSIDSWLQEFVNTPQETAVPPVKTTGCHSSIDPKFDGFSTFHKEPSQVSKGKFAFNRVPKVQSGPATTFPVARRNERETMALESTKSMLEMQKPKRTGTKRGTGPSALFKKTQAKAAVLRANMELTDETKSEAGSSDSGVQSESSSSSSLSTGTLTGEMTTIQRLLHLEEAKKRSWGKTGMPGFRPSATTTIPKLKLF